MKNLISFIIEAQSNIDDFLDLLNDQEYISEKDNDIVKNKYHIDKIELSRTLSKDNKYITLNKIIIKDKNQGYGSMFMVDLCDWADRNKKVICLTPDTSFGGSSVSRLKNFYKEFGFVENKGKNTDFTHREFMHRNPK